MKLYVTKIDGVVLSFEIGSVQPQLVIKVDEKNVSIDPEADLPETPYTLSTPSRSPIQLHPPTGGTGETPYCPSSPSQSPLNSPSSTAGEFGLIASSSPSYSPINYGLSDTSSDFEGSVGAPNTSSAINKRRHEAGEEFEAKRSKEDTTVTGVAADVKAEVDDVRDVKGVATDAEDAVKEEDKDPDDTQFFEVITIE